MTNNRQNIYSDGLEVLSINEIRKTVKVHDNPYNALKDSHAVCILTEWDEFKTYDWKKVYDNMLKPAFLFDGRGVLHKETINEIGFNFYSIGK